MKKKAKKQAQLLEQQLQQLQEVEENETVGQDEVGDESTNATRDSMDAIAGNVNRQIYGWKLEWHKICIKNNSGQSY